MPLEDAEGISALAELAGNNAASADLAGSDLAGSDVARCGKELGGGEHEPENHEKKIDASRTGAENLPGFHGVQKLRIFLSTALRLGAANLARVALYRTAKRAGVYRWLSPPRRAVPLGLVAESLHNATLPSADRSILAEADELLQGRANYFSAHVHEMGNPPDWFLDPFRQQRHPQAATHWSQIPAFSAEAGDIKVVWELSRFSWALVLARAWQISGDTRYRSALQDWMEDWWQNNPPAIGPNWMCGQETSIRLMNALLAWRIAGLEKNGGSGRSAFIEAHCRRIALTTYYATAQDNNHATSEAAGLFLGGTWLARYGNADAKSRGRRWAEKGRKQLNRRVARLVLPDGSFSQHSLTYHRLLLDTLSIVEAWRREAGESPFAPVLYNRAAAATRWLGAMLEPSTGDGPNLGANDGAHPFRLDGSAYRDFRPCLQLASFLFLGSAALGPGPWDEPAAWLGVSAAGHGQPWLDDLSSTVFPDGGYVVMRNLAGARVLLRAPTARFRPSHADALHLDLWWNGVNLLRDGGSYSYAYGDSGAIAQSLASVVGHNLPQFDGHDQMPRISRFLYGSWLRVAGAPAITTTAAGQSWEGSYTNLWGERHQRTVTLTENSLSVLDRVQGFKRMAALRWRMAPGNWEQNEAGCTSPLGTIRVESTVPIRRLSLETAWDSRHYFEKSRIPLLLVEIDQSPAALTTTITLS
jgi:hypothetical protein